MTKPVLYTRPTFDQAQDAWGRLLSERGFSPECLWLFEENLCFENAEGAGKPTSKLKSKDLKLCFQTKFTPPPSDAPRVAYSHFIDVEAPVVFYRIGASAGKSLCVLLCDPWFSRKSEKDGFIRRDDWLMLFHPGKAEELEEITDPKRWKERVIKDRPLHDLDFSMTLRAVHESLAHGRILSSYEHYALRFLHTWSEFRSGKNELDNQNPAS